VRHCDHAEPGHAVGSAEHRGEPADLKGYYIDGFPQPPLSADSLYRAIVDHLVELGEQRLLFLVEMTVLVSMFHDPVVFVRRYLKIADGMVNEFLQFRGGFTGFFHRCPPVYANAF
jgi:hypothetical protein